jgi:NAD(P)-dependent dehydrogenase (short-subunit alcohol dehydrogenase family)
MPASTDYHELAAAAAAWRYYPAADLLAGRTILVTGAGDGIGRAAARTFAHFGANVVLLGRTQQKLEAVFDQITDATDTDPVIVPCDLETAPPDAYEELRESVESHYGRLDGILHNASLLGARQPIEFYDVGQWPRIMQVNVNAAFYLTRALLPVVQRAPDASIVFTSSSVGRRGRAYWGAYAVSKFAVEGLSQVLADELEDVGRVRVNTLNPGATRTGMRAQAYPGEDPATVPEPERHMDLYLYLLGPDSRGLTGRQFDARNWSPER